MVNQREKIKEYRAKIKDKKALQCVDFLDTIFEWIDDLFKKRRLKQDQKEEVESYLPQKIFQELDIVNPLKISNEEQQTLKRILLQETSEFINKVITIGYLRLVDFDLLQFNLAQIFEKQEISAMVEWARVHLSENIKESEEKETEEKERARKRQEEFIQKVRAMPQEELNKLITASMFDFSPSARTLQERKRTIAHHQQVLLIQRKKFTNFENKLIDATEEAKKDAQQMVVRELEKAKEKANNSAQSFKKKAQEIISVEGPRKRIMHAKKTILVQRDRLRNELETKGKWWKEHFFTDIQKARAVILETKDELLLGIEQAQHLIMETGQSEMEGASMMVSRGKSEFEQDVVIAREKFTGIDKEITEAREEFMGKRDIARDRFGKRGKEIETTMYGTIYGEKIRLEKERGKAREKFIQKAENIGKYGKQHIIGKKEKFIAQVGKANKKFIQKAEEIQQKERPLAKKRKGSEVNVSFEVGGKKLVEKAGKTAKDIKQMHSIITGEAEKRKIAMQEEMHNKKNLFLYDVRFARQQIEQRTKEFAEKIDAKREEFETKQEQIIARHKAYQKAHIIQNLLRTIRSMK
jgi:hypothetical protein